MTTPSSFAPSNSPRRMPPASADSAIVWAFLEEGMDDIMANVQTIQYPSYMNLYTVVYNYCTSLPMHGAFDSAVGAGNRSKYFHALLPLQREDGLSDNDDDGADHANAAGANPMGSELYDNLVRYFALHVKGVKEQSDVLRGEDLLRYYASEWDRYTAGAKVIDRSFTFFNRHWVKFAQEKGRTGVFPVYTLALVQWKSIFFLDGQNKLAGIIHRLIESERNGQTINRGHIKKVINSFVSLGLDEIDVNRASLDVYQEHLESPSLEAP